MLAEGFSTPLQRDVLQAQLAAGDLLAVVGAGYDDLPQLLAFALHDRLGDDLDPSLRHRPQEVRGVVDPDGELFPLLHRGRGAQTGRALDGGRVHPAVHDSPRRVVPLVEVDPTPHPTPADLLNPQAGDSEKLAVVGAAPGRDAGPGTLFRHKTLLRTIVRELTPTWARRQGYPSDTALN